MGIFNLVKKAPKKKIDLDKNLDAIIEFIAEVGLDVKELYALLTDFKKLREQEKSEIDEEKHKKLVLEEIKKWDKLLGRWVLYAEDSGISSARVKKVSKALTETANKVKIDADWLKKIKTKDEWVFNW